MAKDDKMIMALIMALIVAGVDGCASNAGIASLHESGWNYIIHQADKKIAKIIKFKSYIGHEIKISHEKPPSKLPKSPKNKPQFFGKKTSWWPSGGHCAALLALAHALWLLPGRWFWEKAVSFSNDQCLLSLLQKYDTSPEKNMVCSFPVWNSSENWLPPKMASSWWVDPWGKDAGNEQCVWVLN